MRKQYLIFTILISALTASCQMLNSGPAASNSSGIAKSENAAKENKPANNPADKKDAVMPVFDGREETKPNGDTATAAEKSMVRAEVKKHEAAIKEKVNFECNEEGTGNDGAPEIISIAGGSFTRAGAQQKLYLYELCRAGRSFGIGGLIIAENDQAVAHYAYGENGLELSAGVLGDINKNGVSEVLLYGGGTGQGYTESGISIHEIKDGNFAFLGNVGVYSDNSGAVEDDAKIKTTASVISVEPGATPVFYREEYEKKGEKGSWSVLKKDEKFTLEKDEPKWVKIA